MLMHEAAELQTAFVMKAATFAQNWEVAGIAYILNLILEVIQGTTDLKVNDLDVGFQLN